MAFYENRSQSKYFDLEKGIELIRKFLKNLTIIEGYKIGFNLYPTEDYIFTSIIRKDGNRAAQL